MINPTEMHDYAKPLLEAVGGRRCLYLANDVMGNVGDRMIDEGTVDFLRLHNVDFMRAPISMGVDPADAQSCGVVLLFGSGSVGNSCSNVGVIRNVARGYGRPMILLPSSAIDSGENLAHYDAVFARDSLSQALMRSGRTLDDVRLAPDMAHWYCGPDGIGNPPDEKVGVFLRSDGAGLSDGDRAIRDPVRECNTVSHYLFLAARFETVITNRLHFAIAALQAGRRAVLLPTTWHKTRAYYQTWEHLFDGRLLWAWSVQESMDLLQCDPHEQQE